MDEDLSFGEVVDPYLEADPETCGGCGNYLDDQGTCEEEDCEESPYFIPEEEEGGGW